MDAPGRIPGQNSGARDLRQARARALALRAGSLVGLPTLLAVAYFGFIASDLYESVSPFTVQSAERGATPGLESIVGAIPGASASKDALAVREYILSRAVLARLNAEHGFAAHYQAQGADFFSRLAPDATSEEQYEYYLSRVDVDYDTLSSVLTLEVRAFTPEKAEELASAILAYSEEMVNSLAERVRLDSIAFARREVEEAESRLKAARTAVIQAQGEGADINPEASAGALLSIRASLEGELARARAELSQARAVMNRNAPQVVALQAKVRSLAAQVAKQDKRLVDPTNGRGMHTSIARFEGVLLEKEFAQAAYQSALTSLEVARADAGRQHRYLATIAPPSKPDEATHPERLRGVLTVFVVCLALFGIFSLLLAAVKEHARL